MSPLIYNLLEVNVYLAIFALAYSFFMRSETFFRLNRAILLGMLALAFILPFVSFPALQASAARFSISLPAIEIGIKNTEPLSRSGLTIMDALMALYVAGLSVFSLRFFYQLQSTLLLIRNSKRPLHASSGLKEIESGHAPASFFNFVFWSSKIAGADAAIIKAHETVHAKEWHSLDLLLAHVATCICWFNPAIHYIRKSIEANHEFRADEVVANRHTDIYTYSNVLLGQAMGVNHKVLAHHFSKPNLLKTRIMMLNKEQSQKSALLKYAFLIPVVGIALAFNACTEESLEDPTNAGKSNEPEVVTLIEEMPLGEKIPGTEIYKVAEVMPEFEGGMGALMVWLGEHIEYPKEAKERALEGLVLLQFVVDKDGHIYDVHQVERQKMSTDGPSQLLVASAIKAISAMPDWTPGEHEGKKVSVQYTLPVKYQLD